MMSTSRAALAAFVTAELAARIGTEIDPDADLFELGLDSIDAVEVTGAIELRLAAEIDPATLFEHRTVNRVVDAVLDLPGAAARFVG
jgi:acyl carrier protein